MEEFDFSKIEHELFNSCFFFRLTRIFRVLSDVVRDNSSIKLSEDFLFFVGKFLIDENQYDSDTNGYMN